MIVTVIDYVLEQLFVHLDDPDPDIQQAVFAVIVVAAHAVDKALVLKMAESSKDSHRSTALCNHLIVEDQQLIVKSNYKSNFRLLNKCF